MGWCRVRDTGPQGHSLESRCQDSPEGPPASAAPGWKGRALGGQNLCSQPLVLPLLSRLDR